MTDAIVETTAGPIRGELVDGVHVFKGVPYGGPTGGLGRWRPPTPPTPWTEVRETTSFGPSCPQPSARPDGWAPEAFESEDCLVLNVWSAGLDGDRPTGDGVVPRRRVRHRQRVVGRSTRARTWPAAAMPW